MSCSCSSLSPLFHLNCLHVTLYFNLRRFVCLTTFSCHFVSRCVSLSPPLSHRWPVSGRRKRFPPASLTIQKTRSNPCWTGPTTASSPKERRDSSLHILPVSRAAGQQDRTVGCCSSRTSCKFCAIKPGNKSVCLCVSLQTVTLWTTRSSMSPCQSISPARSGPESASVRARPPPRSPTAEVSKVKLTAHFQSDGSL